MAMAYGLTDLFLVCHYNFSCYTVFKTDFMHEYLSVHKLKLKDTGRGGGEGNGIKMGR